jgi:hypothetical protein
MHKPKIAINSILNNVLVAHTLRSFANLKQPLTYQWLHKRTIQIPII